MIPSLANLIKPRDIKPETTFDVILKAHLEGKIDQLPEDQRNMLTRWRQANDLMRNGTLVKRGKKQVTQPYTFAKLADFLVNEFKISYRTAYDDIRNAKHFYAIPDSKADKDFDRGVMIEWGERLMFEAAGNGDYKSAAAFYKALLEAKRLLKDEGDERDYPNIHLPHLIVVDDPSKLGFPKLDDPDEAVKRIMAKRKKDKIDLIISQSEPIEFTEQDGNPEHLAE